MFLRLPVAVLLITVSSFAHAQSESQHQHSMKHDTSSADQKHYEDVNRHGDMAMGFSHTKTLHHFGLTTTGGVIQVQTTDEKDVQSREQIRKHLQHISRAFKQGDFAAPQMTHSRIPPGVPTIQRLKSDIEYKYVETASGGKVVISTANPDALKGVHEFLRFQIQDHRTGDPETVQEQR